MTTLRSITAAVSRPWRITEAKEARGGAWPYPKRWTVTVENADSSVTVVAEDPRPILARL